MLLAGGIIVILTFALIIKKIEARLVLFLAGVIMCLIGGLPGDIMKAFMKAMTNNSLVPTICSVMGFSYVMKLTECDQHLVQSISGVLKKGRTVLVPLYRGGQQLLRNMFAFWPKEGDSSLQWELAEALRRCFQ